MTAPPTVAATVPTTGKIKVPIEAPIAAFIPITFELTVLFACIGMVVTFYIVCGLGPGVTNNYLDDRITDDKFCIAFDTSKVAEGDIESFFQQTGAEEVNHKTI